MILQNKMVKRVSLMKGQHDLVKHHKRVAWLIDDRTHVLNIFSFHRETFKNSNPFRFVMTNDDSHMNHAIMTMFEPSSDI